MKLRRSSVAFSSSFVTAKIQRQTDWLKWIQIFNQKIQKTECVFKSSELFIIEFWIIQIRHIAIAEHTGNNLKANFFPQNFLPVNWVFSSKCVVMLDKYAVQFFFTIKITVLFLNWQLRILQMISSVCEISWMHGTAVSCPVSSPECWRKASRMRWWLKPRQSSKSIRYYSC